MRNEADQHDFNASKSKPIPALRLHSALQVHVAIMGHRAARAGQQLKILDLPKDNHVNGTLHDLSQRLPDLTYWPANIPWR